MNTEKITEIVFHELPTEWEIFTNLADSFMNIPEKVAALFIMVLRIYAVDKELGLKMVSYLRHEEELSESEISMTLDAPLRQASYLPLAYLKGSTPQNNYSPSTPYVITVKESREKSKSRKQKTLYIGCPGDGTYRPVTLFKIKKRKAKNKNLLGDPWFISDYTSLMLPVVPPVK